MTDVPKVIDFKHQMYRRFSIDVLNSDTIRLYRIVARLGVAVFSERNI
jgi:hypothetical protein